ncbi:MAG: HAMP domain-containing sensor histidine kinase [Anaeromyxobacteraceae bacterium]
MIHGHRSPHGFLFWRIYGHGLLLIFLIGLVLAAIGWALGRRLPPREPEKVVAYLAARVDERLSTPDRLDSDLRELREGLGLDATVFTPSGGVVTASGVVAPPLSAAQVAELAAGPIHVPDRGYAFAARLPSGAGYIILGPGPHTRPYARWAVIMAVVLAVLAIGSYPTARSITSPLERLTAVARRLGEGDLSVRTGLRARGEVGELARAFDEMAERLQRLVRAERELLANVSHELRTPLARIRVALELAAEGDHEKAQRYLSEIGADLAELDGLVEQILTAARLEGAGPNGIPIHRARVELRPLLEDVAARFRAADPARPLILEVAPALPTIDADTPLLRRLVENLLDNARKYSEPGAPVTLAARAEPGVVVMEVRDRGIGIDPADLPRLFTPFFRTDRSRARGTGGVGLGLNLARRIAEAHGGTISAESSAGAGTTIRVTLPVA